MANSKIGLFALKNKDTLSNDNAKAEKKKNHFSNKEVVSMSKPAEE